MGPPVSLRTRLWIGGLAAGGVAAAHLLAFLLAAPDPDRREVLLKATGHGAYPLVVTLAMGALVIALAGFAASRARKRAPMSAPALFWATVGRLMLLQMVGFLALEGIERLAMGKGLAGLAELFGEPVIAIGLVAQVVVALAGSLLLVLFARVVDRLIHLLREVPRAPRVIVAGGAVTIALSRNRVVTGPANPRGPPRRI